MKKIIVSVANLSWRFKFGADVGQIQIGEYQVDTGQMQGVQQTDSGWADTGRIQGRIRPGPPGSARVRPGPPGSARVRPGPS